MAPLATLMPALLAVMGVALAAIAPYDSIEETSSYWAQQGAETLRRVVERPLHGKPAEPVKNVIIFIGDGMGISTTTAARIYKGQKLGRTGPESTSLLWENFPSVGLFKTYNVDKQVPDSAGTATAMFTGVKSRYYMLGLEARAQLGQCDAEQDPRRRLATLMTWAQRAGKHTGFATTTRVTHATPAALYAAVNHRDWECDTEVPVSQRDCVPDIARQLVESKPGQGFKVVLGGGLKQFGQRRDYNASWDDSCVRGDGRDLVAQWLRDKQARQEHAVFLRTREDLLRLNVNEVDYLLGLFSPGHLPYALETNVTDYSRPSLAEMTLRAIQLLSKSPDGFVLMVEGGRIDQAHHANMAKLALEETLQLEDAVEVAMETVDLSETLIIVTADHSHGFTINGYPQRGNDVLGFAHKPNEEPYETLTYATGPGAVPSIRGERGSIYYRHFAPTFLKDAAHAGEDVAVYAIGPFSHLLTGVFEQNYLAHAVSYAACAGPHSKLCDYKIVSASLTATGTGSAAPHALALRSLLAASMLLLHKFLHRVV